MLFDALMLTHTAYIKCLSLSNKMQIHTTYLDLFCYTKTRLIYPRSWNAFSWYAAIAYLFTILLCTAYRRNLFTVLSIRMRRRQRNSYEDIPDTSLSSGGGSDANLPMFHQEAYNTHRGPCHTVWQRIMMQIKNCTQRLRRPARNKRRREWRYDRRRDWKKVKNKKEKASQRERKKERCSSSWHCLF